MVYNFRSIEDIRAGNVSIDIIYTNDIWEISLCSQFTKIMICEKHTDSLINDILMGNYNNYSTVSKHAISKNLDLYKITTCIYKHVGHFQTRLYLHEDTIKTMCDMMKSIKN